MSHPSLIDRTRGALVGAVIGDAFGTTLEGCSPRDIEALIQRRRHSSGPWRYSDDGAMFIALAESLRDVGTVSPTHFLGRLQAHYEPARGFGRGMKIALRAFENGAPWETVAYAAWPEGSEGNGGAVRVGAVALRPWTSPQALVEAATLATRTTHAHPEAIDAARLQAFTLATVLLDPNLADEPHDLLRRADETLPQSAFMSSLIDKLNTICREKPSLAELAKFTGTSTFARESVPAALGVFFLSHDSYESAIMDASRLGGDVDSICTMVGALAGAIHGYGGIPAQWLNALATDSPTPTQLCGLADGLAEMGQSRTPPPKLIPPGIAPPELFTPAPPLSSCAPAAVPPGPFPPGSSLKARGGTVSADVGTSGCRLR